MNKLAFVLAVVAVVAFAEEEIAVTTKMINEINTMQTLWRAAHNRITRMPKSQARALLGVNYQRLPVFIGSKHFTAEQLANAPDSFDSRTQWPNCGSMTDIRDQRQCGSCWAFGAVEAMSDRICAVTGRDTRLSAQDVLACSNCGSCSGGYPSCAWEYYVNTGVVTEKCLPYTTTSTTPACTKKCTDASIDYNSDKHKGSKTYTVSGEANMKTEVSTNGPFEVAFQVYADFMSYSGGIYFHQAGGYEGGHAVKLLGYGAEGGVNYWICANSWNTDWGEKGYFRIRRGTNECGIESQAWAGTPAEN